jgi:hypothetical protein
MGATFSPYQMGQGMGHAKERIVGHPKDLTNLHHWSMVRLNLLGSELYDPSMVWVAKHAQTEEWSLTCSSAWMISGPCGQIERNADRLIGRREVFAITWGFRRRQGRG